MDSQRVNPLLSAKIVGSYVRHHTVGARELPDLITSVYQALGEVGRPSPSEELLTPAVSVRQSVRHDYVVCLDCGYRAKMLLRHITRQHGLSRDEYLKRWGLRRNHPLTAPGYSEQRSSMAKALGLGHKVKVKAKAGVGPATAPTASASTEVKHRRRRSTGSTSKSDVVKKAAAENTPASPKRSRSKSNFAAT